MRTRGWPIERRIKVSTNHLPENVDEKNWKDWNDWNVLGKIGTFFITYNKRKRCFCSLRAKTLLFDCTLPENVDEKNCLSHAGFTNDLEYNIVCIFIFNLYGKNGSLEL